MYDLLISSSGTVNEFNNLEKTHINSQSGSMISWTGRLWHKSSANHSNKPRIVLLIMFSSSIFKEISTEEFYGSHVLNDNGFLKFPNRFKSLIGFSHGKRLGT
jgi:ectoine hydroxylase-related dioxygenase (phytanoyl-CoA dioxygenase family)